MCYGMWAGTGNEESPVAGFFHVQEAQRGDLAFVVLRIIGLDFDVVMSLRPFGQGITRATGHRSISVDFWVLRHLIDVLLLQGWSIETDPGSKRRKGNRGLILRSMVCSGTATRYLWDVVEHYPAGCPRSPF